MKKLLMAALAVGALAAGAPTVSASPGDDPHHYEGGCSFSTVNDTSPNQALGGNDSWNGQGSVVVQSTNGTTPTTDPITAECEIYVDGQPTGTTWSTVGPGTGGVGVGAAKIQYTAGEGTVVSVCTTVTVNSDPVWGPHKHCDDGTRTPIVPEPVAKAINDAIDTLNHEVFEKIDPTLCAILALFTGQYGPIYISPYGDVFLFGHDEPDHLWWDCPPYYVPPAA